jgi:hypothetical protein
MCAITVGCASYSELCSIRAPLGSSATDSLDLFALIPSLHVVPRPSLRYHFNGFDKLENDRHDFHDFENGTRK